MMTFDNKLKKLRKENGLSQEDLANQLGVSRQSVSKWENGQGFPETDKIIMMSSLFGVSIDYLLKEDGTPEEGGEEGFYVSRETAEGYLINKYQTLRAVAMGVSVLILSIVWPVLFESPLGVVLFFVNVMIGVGMLVAKGFEPKRYSELEEQLLFFDPANLQEMKISADINKRKYGKMVVAGIIVLISSLMVGYLFSELNPFAQNEQYMALLPVFWAIGVHMLIISGGMIESSNLLLDNKKYLKEKSDRKSVV